MDFSILTVEWSADPNYSQINTHCPSKQGWRKQTEKKAKVLWSAIKWQLLLLHVFLLPLVLAASLIALSFLLLS
jgi:hypothetical protein